MEFARQRPLRLGWQSSCRPSRAAKVEGDPELSRLARSKANDISPWGLKGVSVSKVGGKFARIAAVEWAPRNPSPYGGPSMAELHLTPEQEAQAQALFQ